MNATAKDMQESSTQIAEFNEFEAKLAEFKQQYDGMVYDLDDPDQNKQARSDRLAIGKVIARLDDKHREIKAPLKERVDLIDGERKRIKDQLLDVQGKIKGQIEEYDRKKQEHEDMLQAKVDYFTASLSDLEALGTPTAAVLRGLLAELEAIEVDDTYEHRKADATLAQVDAIKKLKGMIAEREKYEAEQAELEKLRKEAEERARLDREEQIRKEAEDRARAQAEEAHKRELAAAEQAKREAEQRAERAAQEERARIEREQREAAAKADQERKANEAKKAKQAHRAKIHAAAKASLMQCGLDEATATQVVTCIKDGNIDHVQIVY